MGGKGEGENSIDCVRNFVRKTQKAKIQSQCPMKSSSCILHPVAALGAGAEVSTGLVHKMPQQFSSSTAHTSKNATRFCLPLWPLPMVKCHMQSTLHSLFCILHPVSHHRDRTSFRSSRQQLNLPVLTSLPWWVVSMRQPDWPCFTGLAHQNETAIRLSRK